MNKGIAKIAFALTGALASTAAIAQSLSIDNLSENTHWGFIAAEDGNLYQKVAPQDYLAGLDIDARQYDWCIWPWGCWLASERRLVRLDAGPIFKPNARGPVFPSESTVGEIFAVPGAGNFGLGSTGDSPVSIPPASQ